MDVKCQYLFAIRPPTELTDEIHQIRIAFAEKYNCKAALKPPVHITLLPNFWMLPRAEAKIEWLTEWAATLQPFTIKLRDYSTFPDNGVVFIEVASNAELNALRMGLTKVKDSLPSGTFRAIGPFHPHITIGYRDIPTEVYSQAAAEYQGKSFAAEFEVDEFELWKHNGKRWETLYTYEMKCPPKDRGD